MVRYGEGIFIGYRYYDAKEIPVQFPFGYGLSYTTFSYKNPKVSANKFKDGDSLTVSVDVTNTGSLAGKEIVQVYVHDHKSRLVRPPKELKGFIKVELQPGETKTVTIPLDFRAFAYYDPAHKQWITEDGEFDILIGASSADIRCTQTVTMQSTPTLPSILNRESTLRDWLEDPRGRLLLTSYVHQLPTQLQIEFFGTHSEVLGIDLANFLLDTPLPNRFHILEGTLPESPEEIVDKLLARLSGTT